jgi:hypothetical protein
METTQNTITFKTSVAWGGDDDNETFADVLASIRTAIPSSTLAVLDARPQHSGNWPFVQITFDLDDLAAAENFFDCEF